MELPMLLPDGLWCAMEMANLSIREIMYLPSGSPESGDEIGAPRFQNGVQHSDMGVALLRVYRWLAVLYSGKGIRNGITACSQNARTSPTVEYRAKERMMS